MADPWTLDPRKTTVLIMDFQNDIIKLAAGDPEGVVARAAQVLSAARSAGIPVMHVAMRGGRFAEPSQGAEIHSGVAPAPGEPVWAKTRVGPFSTTGLDVALREKGIDTLVLMGVSTSGCVLSTVHWAADLGFRVVVVSDGCSEKDPDIHRVLMEKIYPRRGTVVTAKEFGEAARRVSTVRP